MSKLHNKITRLGGNSGADIFLYQDAHGRKIVKKQSKDKIQSLRLEKQYKKHMFFLSLKDNVFHVPSIISNGFIQGMFFYEYGYIEGVDLITYMRQNDEKEMFLILDKLLNIIESFKNESYYFEKEYNGQEFNIALREKILAASNTIGLDPLTTKLFLTKLQNIPTVEEKTLCHGDLSFDNIIVDKEKNIWLIDYLGSYYPHYWLDISKLFQDLEGKWFEIKHKIHIDEEKTSKLTDYLKKKVNEIDNRYILYHRFLMALNFLRILPYLQSESEKKKVMEKMKLFLYS